MAQNKRPDNKVEIGVKILAEKKTPAYLLRLQTGDAELRMTAYLTVFDAENTIAPSELIELLAQNGVKENLDLEEIAKFCSKAAMGINQENVLLAQGTPPGAGKDGWLELTVKTSSSEAEFTEDDKGYVDLRTRHTFTNVEAGQQVGIIHPPQAGNPGKTVNGLPIPALMGKALEALPGEGIEFTPDGQKALATRAGRVVFDGRVLSIAEEFVVSGDVDLSVGNIDFNGFVEIKGDVLDDFHIRASKGIRVTGSVGACHLEAGGPVQIGGMAGLDIGTIKCRGDLTAGYLNQVEVQCYGTVNVAREIRNSTVKATRAIVLERGAIIGGETVALDGIEARVIGAVSGLRTLLTAGVYFPEADRLKELRYKQRSYNLQIQRIGAALGPLSGRTGLRKALQEAIELRISLLTERKVYLEQEKVQIDAELETFRTSEHPTANPKINILGRLMEGVVIHLGEAVEEIQQEHTGPISVIENTQSGGLRFVEHSPLKVMAAEIEAQVFGVEETSNEAQVNPKD